mmetsp:Transcript_21763/g.61939  ORF Transcript_21763/g.61939 Transcript_21763/m.61939 type:complete len:132 (+) Transcript_21763:119-514(+)
MRLLTHNYLQSNVKGTTKGYPLTIEPREVVVEDSPVDKDLVMKMLSKIEYAALRKALAEVADAADPKPAELPEEAPAGDDGEDVDPSVVENLHHAMFNIHVIEGDLVCPDTGRKFPIKQGIPNMILHEDEI